MYRAGYLCLFVGAYLLSIAVGVQAEEIQWTKSPQNAVDTAHGTGRMILISVQAPSCIYCTKMDHEVWHDPAVEQLVTKEFVPLRLTDVENADLIKKLEVATYPSTFIFSSDRRPLARLDGFVTTSELKRTIERIRDAIRPALSR